MGEGCSDGGVVGAATEERADVAGSAREGLVGFECIFYKVLPKADAVVALVDVEVLKGFADGRGNVDWGAEDVVGVFEDLGRHGLFAEEVVGSVLDSFGGEILPAVRACFGHVGASACDFFAGPLGYGGGYGGA